MSVLVLMPSDMDEVQDTGRYRLGATGGAQTHQADPGEALMTVGENVPAHLPDASTGGQNGTGQNLGYSTGFVGIRQRLQPFMGAVIQVPREQLPVQGNVGASNRAGRLYAGVMDQLTQYTPSQADYVSSYVGPVPVGTVIQGR